MSEDQGVTVEATHIESGRGLYVRDYYGETGLLFALARVLDASDEFTNVRMTVNRQEEVAWR